MNYLVRRPKKKGAGKLKKHAQQHSKKHMAEMRKKMKEGKTFAEAHREATRQVGK